MNLKTQKISASCFCLFPLLVAFACSFCLFLQLVLLDACCEISL